MLLPPKVPDHELLRRIGQGSYGEVWLARNAVGTLRAIKLVFRSRFKDQRPYEREFSGIQKYEPISRSNEGLVDVLQIGRNDEQGYFYYVMELADDAAQHEVTAGTPALPKGHKGARLAVVAVEGLKVPALSDPGAYVPRTLAREIQARGRVPVQECITLGLNLNLALGHLHRHGLIHRDVKPSNIIFVSGVPKLADIGLVVELAEAQSFVGTEGFIPPEGPNSPQADIYALGKVLYEASMGKDRHDFPEPHSSLGTDPDAKTLMELNAVLLKACAANPRDRYRSAEEMNADLALLNSGQSVQQKHALQRRVKVLTRVGVALAAVVVLGAVPYGLTIKEMRAAKLAAKLEAKALANAKAREQEAHDAETQAKQILEFFQRHVLAAPRPEGEPEGISMDVTGREALLAAEKMIPTSFSNQPLAEAQVRETLGATYIYQGDYARAAQQLEPALPVLRRMLGSDRELTLSVMNDLAVAYDCLGEYQKALPLMEETVGRCEAARGPDHRETLISMHGLATLYRELGREQDALTLELKTFERRKATLSPSHDETLSSMAELGNIYQLLGRLPDAISILEQELALARSNLPPSHPTTVIAMGSLANAYSAADRFEDALPLREMVLEQRRRVYGIDAPQTLISQNNLAATYGFAGRYKEAIALHEDTLKLRRAKLGEDHPDTLYSMHNLAYAYRKDGRLAEAIAMYQRAFEGRKRRLGPDHPDTLFSMTGLALAYVEAHQLTNAAPLSRQALELATAKNAADHPLVLSCKHTVAYLYEAQGDYAHAIPIREELARVQKKKDGASKGKTVTAFRELAVDLLETRQFTNAEKVCRELLGPQQPGLPANASTLAPMQLLLSEALLREGRQGEAEALAGAAMDACRKNRSTNWIGFSSQGLLGACRFEQKNYAEAEPLLLAAIEGLGSATNGETRHDLKNALETLVQLDEATSRPQEATKWRNRLAVLGPVN